MIGLLTAFFLYTAEAHWIWWVLWALLSIGEVIKFVRNS